MHLMGYVILPMLGQCLSCCNDCENGQDCQNGGSCYCDQGPATAQCFCFNNYTGDFCEISPGMHNLMQLTRIHTKFKSVG